MQAPAGFPRTRPLLTTFEEVVSYYQHHVYRVCLGILGEEQAAKDATQETFFAAWRHNRDASWSRPVQAWLARIASNKCIDEIRRRSRRGRSLEACFEAGAPEPAAEERGPDFPLLNAELRAELSDAVMQLPDEQRLSLLLFDVEGLRYSEIARMSGVPVGTVKSRIFRARMTLRTQLTVRIEPALLQADH